VLTRFSNAKERDFDGHQGVGKYLQVGNLSLLVQSDNTGLDCQPSFRCKSFHFKFKSIFFFEQVKLAQHVYSCLFGTFLCNSESERLKANIVKRTFSVWSLLKLRRKELKNYLYSSSSEQVGLTQLFEFKVVMLLLPQRNVKI